MTATSGGQPPAVKSPRWLKLALIASLAVNLLVIGTIGGSIWAFRHGEHWHGPGGSAYLIGFTRTLSKDRRYAIWQATREERRALRPLRMEVRKARTEARTVFTAEPFDRQRFAEAQARVQEAEAKARAEAHKLFIAVASVLTPEERAAFAKWEPAKRAERMRMWRRGWSGDDGKAATAPAQPR